MRRKITRLATCWQSVCFQDCFSLSSIVPPTSVRRCHPGVRAPPPEARVPVKLHIYSRAHYHLDPRQPPGAREGACDRERGGKHGGASGPSGPT